MNMSMMIAVFASIGAIFGSFAGAQVWRLRARQLVQDEREGERVSQRELRQLKGLVRRTRHDRSECLKCHHVLAWNDLVPIVSWVALGGKCRYCHEQIGRGEILIETGMAILFVASLVWWPWPLVRAMDWLLFGIWLLSCVLMAILSVYDARWYLLPFHINLFLIVVALLYRVITLLDGRWSVSTIPSLAGGIIVLAGLYALFAWFGWVGAGDSILAVALALFAGSLETSLILLFLANLYGCLALFPPALRGKVHRSMRIPFGPFLILATITVVLWGDQLLQWAERVLYVT